MEPRNCTYHGFEIRDADPNPVDVVDVVGYEDSFDVFMTGLSYDEPHNIYAYRYSDEGKPVSSVVNSAIPGNRAFGFSRALSKLFYVHANLP